MSKKTRIAIIGCGLGGATVAALLQRQGFDVRVFEQTPSFAPLGAGIHITPNAMRVAQQLGIESQLVQKACSPASFASRRWNDGAMLFNLPLGEEARARHGAPYLTIERGTIQHALISASTPGTVHYGMALRRIEERDDDVVMHFENGAVETADIVVGADGLASRLRDLLQGIERPLFSGQAAYRSMFPASLLKARPQHELTKWWASDRFVIAYYLDAAKNLFYFVAGHPCEQWAHPSTSVPGVREEMLEQFADFHPEVLSILESSPPMRQWPLFERRPNPLWHGERIVLLGDACHPMRPHMAQGACMAMEDAQILTRCLADCHDGNWQRAFQVYARTRVARTAQVQKLSAVNDWLREPTDPSWLFSYDACSAMLSEHDADMLTYS